MGKYEFNDLIGSTNDDYNNYNYLQNTNTGTNTAIGTLISSSNGLSTTNGLNTTYVVDIPDGEISLSELNEKMNVLKNAFDHIQIKIKALEQNKESEKINKRNIFKK
jgi:hypothetical protein